MITNHNDDDQLREREENKKRKRKTEPKGGRGGGIWYLLAVSVCMCVIGFEASLDLTFLCANDILLPNLLCFRIFLLSKLHI